MNSYETALSIIRQLKENGHTTYIAGGWVRDFFLEHRSDDIDIATSASVEEITTLFPKTIPVGINFGIVIVVEEGHHFEVATFRKDLGYEDGRRPTGIAPSDPKEDAMRRDFTINGMFYDPIEKKLHDFVGGKDDLEQGIIRAIGNAHERFLEDRLRMMRAVRYSCRFQFPIETKTLQAIIAHANDLFPSVAYERIWQEFVKMARFAHFNVELITLHRLNLLQQIFPSLKDTHADEIQSRVEHLPRFPDNCPVIAKVLELFPNSTLDDKLAICRQFRLSNKELLFVEYLQKVEEAFSNENLELYDWAKLYANEDFFTALNILGARLEEQERKTLFTKHKKQMQKLFNPILRIQKSEPIIRSHHLKEQGIKPGKAMGSLLHEAERIATNEGLEDLEALLARLRESSHWPTSPE